MDSPTPLPAEPWNIRPGKQRRRGRGRGVRSAGGLVVVWAEREQAAPEAGARGREVLDCVQFVFAGTLRRDGAPRVTPVEACVIDGHLLVNMIARSLKALDLL